jgi:ankyrin repeat protein
VTLFEAAKAGDAGAVEALLRDGADVNAREAGDHTYALHWAAAGGHLAVVKLLVEAGGDVHGEGDDHALGVIGWATCWERAQPEIAEFLVSQGAQHHIFSALALGLEDKVRAIVAANPGALNQRMSRNENHQLPLHFAVARGRADMVELLIELGADPLAVDGFKHHAAAYATGPGVDDAVMRAIHALGQAELASAERGGRPARGYGIDVMAALALGDTDTAARFVNALGPGVVHLLAKRGDAEGVRWLLGRGADPDALWRHFGVDVTALHLAALGGHEEAAQVLLAAGADPTIRDSVYNADALGWAQHFKHEALVALFEPEREESVNVVLEVEEQDAHLSEILEAFDDPWVVGISSTSGVVRLDLETPGATWGAAVTLVEGRLERLPFDWRSHVALRRP